MCVLIMVAYMTRVVTFFRKFFKSRLSDLHLSKRFSRPPFLIACMKLLGVIMIEVGYHRLLSHEKPHVSLSNRYLDMNTRGW